MARYVLKDLPVPWPSPLTSHHAGQKSLGVTALQAGTARWFSCHACAGAVAPAACMERMLRGTELHGHGTVRCTCIGSEGRGSAVLQCVCCVQKQI